MAGPRDIRWSKQATTELEEIHGDLQRADELLFGLDIALARHPENGLPVPGTALWALPAETFVEYPVIFFYRFDDQMVEVMSVKFVEEIENRYGEDEEEA